MSDPELPDRGGGRSASSVIDQEADNQASLMEAIGRASLNMGFTAKARPHLEGALEIRRKHFAGDSPSVASTLTALGRLEYLEGRSEQGAKLYAEALEMNERLFGPNHPTVAEIWVDRGQLLHVRGDLRAAQQALERGLDLYSQCLGPDSPPALAAMIELTQVLQSLGEFEQAEGVQQRAIELSARRLGIEPVSSSFRPPAYPPVSDRRHVVDLNITLTGLDAYEAASIRTVLTEHLPSLVAAARQENSDERIRQLLRAVAPSDPLADIELKVAEDSTTLRREFLERVPVLTSTQVHHGAGFPGGNASQTVHRWRKQHKIFSVNQGGRELYPAFQFADDGRPRPLIAELLEILARDAERTDWDNALWFAGDSGWLEGKTPLELLIAAPDLVKRAAEQEVLRDEP